MSSDTQEFRKERWSLVPRAVKVFLSVPGMVYDLAAALNAAAVASALGFLSQDDAYKYVDNKVLYWLKFSLVVDAACVSAFQLFRSKSFAEHTNRKDPKS